MEVLDNERILKNSTAAKPFREVMLVVYTIQIKQESAGGKMATLNILQKSLIPVTG